MIANSKSAAILANGNFLSLWLNNLFVKLFGLTRRVYAAVVREISWEVHTTLFWCAKSLHHPEVGTATFLDVGYACFNKVLVYFAPRYERHKRLNCKQNNSNGKNNDKCNLLDIFSCIKSFCMIKQFLTVVQKIIQ